MSNFCPEFGAQSRISARFGGSCGPIAIFGGEKRKVLVVDELGNVQVQKV